MIFRNKITDTALLIFGAFLLASCESKLSVRASKIAGKVQEQAVGEKQADLDSPQLTDLSVQSFLTNTPVAKVSFQNSGAAAVACNSEPIFPSGMLLTAELGSCVISGTPVLSQTATQYTVMASSSSGATGGASIVFDIRAAISPAAVFEVIDVQPESQSTAYDSITLSWTNPVGAESTALYQSNLNTGFSLVPDSSALSLLSNFEIDRSSYIMTGLAWTKPVEVVVAVKMIDGTIKHLKPSVLKLDKPKLVAFDLGRTTMCAVYDNGRIRCWGSPSNTGYDPAENIVYDAGPPIQYVNLDRSFHAVDVKVSNDFACALSRDGLVTCWGAPALNPAQHSWLGHEVTEESVRATGKTLPFPGNAKIKQISVHYAHGCGVSNEGQLFCWGNNDHGRLGTGDQSERPTPVLINLGVGRTAKSVDTGSGSTCVILDDDSVKCWGYNNDGALATGDNVNVISGPGAGIDFLGVAVKKIEIGAVHACALLKNNETRCWGNNQGGQLGYGDAVARLNPGPAIDFGTGKYAVDISVGDSFYWSWATCALLNTGEAKCWGNNYEGNIGVKPVTHGNITAPPVAAIDITGNTVEIKAGTAVTCARNDDSEIRCWGWAWSGVLGIGLGYEKIPKKQEHFLSLKGFEAVGSHACGVTSGGDGFCFGRSRDNCMGYGDGVSHYYDTQPPLLGLSNVNRLIPMDRHTCALFNDGTLSCWGINAKGQLGYGDLAVRSTPPVTKVNLGGLQVLDVKGSLLSTCALLDNLGKNVLKCWGQNNTGIAGVGDKLIKKAPPASIDFGTNSVLDFDVSRTHACAVLDNGELRCWGANTSGQLGYGDLLEKLIPGGTVATGGTAVEVDVSDKQTCVRLADKTVKCFGLNTAGQLGYDDEVATLSPRTEAVNFGEPVESLSVIGDGTVCGRLTSGQVKCWGSVFYLGNGLKDTTRKPGKPVKFPDGLKATAIQGESFSVCAKMSDGSDYCWGYNGEGVISRDNFARAPRKEAINIYPEAGLTP